MNARKDEEMVDVGLAAPMRVRGHESPPVDDDAALLHRIASRDRDAFEALYRRYARPVYALALRRLGDAYAAEEVVQETFIAVWRAARSFRPERGFASTWLYAIARNAVVDRYRSRPEPVEDPPDAPSGESGPPERAEAGWLSWRVHLAVGDLPEGERRVVELAYWGGLSQTEIAERLELPLGTVKTRTRNGLARLARALEGEDLR